VRPVWERYRRPVLLAETGGYAERRGPWLDLLVREAAALLNAGVDLQGVCLYPFVDAPEWESGAPSRLRLYEVAPGRGRERVPDAPAVGALRRWQARLAGPGEGRGGRAAVGAGLAAVRAFASAAGP
jgi:hypothetical protein